MAASTIPNSGGPGSSIKLSPMTIAVRDKVIEKFADQPLDEMNESVKQLLSREEDEQKRLGILAARVYILRQRITKISEGDADRIVSSAAPKAVDLMPEDGEVAGGDPRTSEWTRLRILDDCEVNGVRFPKTVIIDVKSGDAEKLIASGSAELVEEDSVTSTGDAAPAADDTTVAASEDAGEHEAGVTAEMPGADAAAEPVSDDPPDSTDDLSALSATLEEAPAPQMEVEEPPQPSGEAQNSGDEDAIGEAVIDAPSAAEVTAALEALSNGDSDSEPASAPVEAAAETAAPEPSAPDVAAAEDNTDDTADVAAELNALSAALTLEGEAAPEADDDGSDAAAVAAELEAAAAAMEAGPSNPDTSDLPPAGGEDEAEADGTDKPAGWFEAQQNAEASKRDEDKPEDEKA